MSLLKLALFSIALPCSVAAQLQGVVDLHVHCAPDSGPRAVDAFEVARLARRHDMRALLFKNHYTQTASLAYLVAQAVPGVEVFGGIALNRSVGGLNPVAVERMAASTDGYGRVVWMPTFDSEHYHRVVEPNPQHVPVSKDGKLLPEVLVVLDVMVKHDLALATGHSSPAESLLLIAAAKAKGIERIIVTHPQPPPVAMSVADQKKAAALGAFLEYPFNSTLPADPKWGGGGSSLDEYAASIREVGVDHVILSSDLGQPMNPVHTEGLKAYFEGLLERGFTQPEIDRMAKRNPAAFLGLPLHD